MIATSFPSPRIVIVDDQDDEAMPIVDAFSHLNFPVARFAGTGPDQMPSEPLKHVRLLILDLHLQTSGFDPKYTAGIILNTISPTMTSGPCIICVWTSHSDYVDQVKQELNHYNSKFEEIRQVKPIGWITLDKNKLKNDEDAFDTDTIFREVKKIVNEFKPVELLLEWESLCAEAASSSIDNILSYPFDLSLFGTPDWNKIVEVVIVELARSTSGSNFNSDMTSDEFRNDLYRSLAFLHEDTIRNISNSSNDDYRVDAGSETKAIVAAINTMLLSANDKDSYMPGAVCPMKGMRIEGLPFDTEYNEDKKDFSKGYKQFILHIFQRNYREAKKYLMSDIEPVMIEMTPPCDYAQRKRKILRYAAGLIVPFELAELLPPNAQYLKICGPLCQNGKLCCLVADSMHFFTLPIDTEIENPPFFRLRSHVQSDIRSWLAGHMARPGHISMDLRYLS